MNWGTYPTSPKYFVPFQQAKNGYCGSQNDFRSSEDEESIRGSGMHHHQGGEGGGGGSTGRTDESAVGTPNCSAGTVTNGGVGGGDENGGGGEEDGGGMENKTKTGIGNGLDGSADLGPEVTQQQNGTMLAPSIAFPVQQAAPSSALGMPPTAAEHHQLWAGTQMGQLDGMATTALGGMMHGWLWGIGILRNSSDLKSPPLCSIMKQKLSTID